jgi:hypothetical protein
MGWGGRREGAGRPKGLHGVKSTELAEMLDSMGANPAKALARLGLKAEREGDDDLAVRAFSALMPYRFAKLKETSIGFGLDGNFADLLDAAEGRLQLTVVSGIDRPPDDPGAIEPDPVPKPSPAAPTLRESPKQSSPSPAASPPKPRPATPPPPSPPASSPPPEPPAPGGVMSAHAYWSQKREPEVKPISDYDPWETPT